MQLPARFALNEMLMQCVPFLLAELAVNVGREPGFDFVVQSCFHFHPSEVSAGRRRLRKVCSARPRIPRSAPLLNPSSCSIAA